MLDWAYPPLRGHNWCILPIGYSVLIHWIQITLNSNYTILKNLKLFSIRVKELVEPKDLRKKGDRILLFSKAFLEKPIFE